MRRWLATLTLLGTAWLATAAPERIASYSPGATRTLVDFGAADKIVAATRWCPLPAAHPAVRDCDVFNPDLERLLRAKPDLVILPRTSNPLWALAAGSPRRRAGEAAATATKPFWWMRFGI